jgi:uncharacterized protein
LRRFVIDASTLVSGVASRPAGSAPALLLSAVIDVDLEAIACPRLIDEFKRALASDYFRERFGLEELEEIVEAVEETVVMRENPGEVEPILRDPGDDYLVALAREAGAEAIVTGDLDLLDHSGLEPPAINARKACELLGLALNP